MKRASDIITGLKSLVSEDQKKVENHDLDKLIYSVLFELEERIPAYITVHKKLAPGISLFCNIEQLQQVILWEAP